MRQALPVPLPSGDEVVECLWQRVTPRTRLIFTSHITSPTAVCLPVDAICRRARTNGILTLIDGAHAPGQVEVDLEKIGADFYTGNLHKWLCAPKGAGFLYARPEVQHLLDPLVISWGYESEAPSGSPFVDYFEWWGTRDIAAFLSVPAAIDFQALRDWKTIQAACHELLGKLLSGIARITGLPPFYSNDGWYAQMATASLPPEVDIVTLKSRLYDKYRIEVPLMDWNGRKLMRISIQGYNTQRDAEHLLEALPHLL